MTPKELTEVELQAKNWYYFLEESDQKSYMKRFMGFEGEEPSLLYIIYCYLFYRQEQDKIPLETFEILTELTQYLEKQALWDKCGQSYYKAIQLIKKLKN